MKVASGADFLVIDHGLLPILQCVTYLCIMCSIYAVHAFMLLNNVYIYIMHRYIYIYIYVDIYIYTESYSMCCDCKLYMLYMYIYYIYICIYIPGHAKGCRFGAP